MKSTIEKLAELAKGATQGEWHLRLSDNATPFIMHENGEDWTDIEDRTSIVCWMPAEISYSFNSVANARLMAECNPAAISQAHAEYAELERRNAELVAALEHIREYWNRDQNESAMADALWHIIETAEAALAHSAQEKAE